MDTSVVIESTIDVGGDISTTFETGQAITSTISGGVPGPSGPAGPTGPAGPEGPPGSLSYYFDITAYGAIGNGVFDCTAAINAAAAACYTVGGGTVFVPEGNYLISGVITMYPGVSWLGVGATASLITQTSTTADAFYMTNASVLNASLSFAAIGVTGPGSGSGSGIYIFGEPVVYISMRDVAVQSFGATGIYIGGPIVSTLERVTSTTNNLHGIWIDGTTSFVTSTTLINCYGNDNHGAGIYFKQVTYCSMDGCAADSNGIGYYLYDVSGFSASGCGTESSQSHSLSGYPGNGWVINGSNTFGSTSVSLSGCFVYDCHNIAYLVTGYSTGVSLNSVMDSTPHSGASYSLEVDVDATVSLLNCTFAGSKLFTGGVIILADPANDENSTLKAVWTGNLVVSDDPLVPGSMTSGLVFSATGGVNYLESVGAGGTGSANLIIADYAVGLEYIVITGSTGAVDIPHALTVGGALVASVGLTVTTGGVTVTAGGLTVSAGGMSITGASYVAALNVYGDLIMQSGTYIESLLIIDVIHAITVTSNAGTADSGYKNQTFTNSSDATMAITLPTTGPVDCQPLIIRIYDHSGTAETIGWTNTENSKTSAPTTSNGSTTLPLTVGFEFNGATSLWRCIAVT